ncbi:MAG: hypothetical protein GF364_17280 [Candidatus Lokiarchaeota archaeon]|nr:hypothetical protein [Candidatus Lokiarchaeota archaeon]
MPKVIIGSINIDMYRLSNDKLITTLGGSATNTCFFLTNLMRSYSQDNNLSQENRMVYLIGGIGADSAGKQALDLLKEKGINTKYVGKLSGHTGKTEITLDDRHERHIKRFPSVTNQLPNYITTPAIQRVMRQSDIHVKGSAKLLNAIWDVKDSIYSADISAFDSDKSFISNIKELKDKQIKILFGNNKEFQNLAYSAGIDVNLNKLGSENRTIDYINNAEDINIFVEEILDLFKSEYLFFKLGSKGAIYFRNNNQTDKLEHHWNKFSITTTAIKIIDTTGAGDAFNAGVLFGLWNGFSPKKSISFGNILGTFNCTRFGGTNYVMSYSDMKAKLIKK